MKNFTTPTEWKSEIWWRNRPVDERLFHMHLPPRVLSDLHDSTYAFPALMAGEVPPNRLIYGPPGSGKSVRAAAYLSHYVNCGLSGRWVNSDDYIDMIKDSFDTDGKLSEEYSSPYLVKNIKGVFDVVVIDALGEERLTEFAIHELGSLIRKRYEKMKPTIITSKLSLLDIRHKYGERLHSVMESFEDERLSKRGR